MLDIAGSVRDLVDIAEEAVQIAVDELRHLGSGIAAEAAAEVVGTASLADL